MIKKQKFNVLGMHCSACSSAVTKAVNKVDGVEIANVNLLTNSMEVTYNDTITDSSTIITSVIKCGFNANIQTELKIYKEENKYFKYRLYISLILMIVLLYVSMGKMFNFPFLDYFKDNSNGFVFAVVQLIISLPIYLLNYKYFTSGFGALFNKRPNMDSLIAIGSGASLIYSLFALYKIYLGDLHFVHSLYFESGGVILGLVTVGKYIESLAKDRTSDAIAKLINLAPTVATIKVGDQTKEVYISQLNINDIVICKAGEKIPCDGVIINGETNIDEAMITGESLPVDKRISDHVIGGTINISGYIEIKVTKLNKDSTLSKIIELVENASSSKAPISKFADRVSAVFVPIVITLSILTFIYWITFHKDLEQAMSFAICVLVISCPCALGIATPSAIMVATGIAASNNILLKDATSLELSSKIDTIIFDKTGTLTKGKPEIRELLCLDDSLEYIAYSLETNSTHPIANSITSVYKFDNPLVFDIVKEISGMGLIAKKGSDSYYAGNRKLYVENNINIDKIDSELSKLEECGYTNLIFAQNDKILGVISISDTLKEDSAQTISLLNDMKIDTIMLTGDNHKVAKNIAEDLKLSNFVAELLPKDKLDYIKNLQKSHKICCMVGDGINDAPALIQANISIAIGSGSDIAIDSANVILTKNSLKDVVTFINLSKKTMLNIKENLFWALIYNVIGIPIAMGVFYISFGLKLNPMLGAFAMSFSSLTVVLNALRLNFFKS